jgi:hypothetical protein
MARYREVMVPSEASRFLFVLLLASGVTALSVASCADGEPVVCIAAAPFAGACPVQDSPILREFLAPEVGCDKTIETIEAAGKQGDACCYAVTTDDEPDACCGVACCYQACAGRPFVAAGAAIVAGVVASDTWTGAEDRRGAGVVADSLSRVERDALVDFWTRAGLDEHASVAAFARASLDLLAHGAPASLVAAAHEAALDEVRHARESFALASRYARRQLGPGPLPVGARVELSRDLAELAVAAFVEGCVGETSSACVAREQARLASDAQVRATLERIAADEERHAALAFRTVRWAIEEGGASVRRAVDAAIEGAAKAPSRPVAAAPTPARLAAHGLLGAEGRDEVARWAVRSIVLPAARALVDRLRGEAASAGRHRGEGNDQLLDRR